MRQDIHLDLIVAMTTLEVLIEEMAQAPDRRTRENAQDIQNPFRDIGQRIAHILAQNGHDFKEMRTLFEEITK